MSQEASSSVMGRNFAVLGGMIEPRRSIVEYGEPILRVSVGVQAYSLKELRGESELVENTLRFPFLSKLSNSS